MGSKIAYVQMMDIWNILTKKIWKLFIFLEQKKVKDIVFITKVEGQLNPLFMVQTEEQFLKDFQWHIEKKPLEKEDIFKK